MDVMQERTASLSRMTVQAPQSASPQPNLVPVRPISSRINQSRGSAGSPSHVCSWPFIFNFIMIVSPIWTADLVQAAELRQAASLRGPLCIFGLSKTRRRISRADEAVRTWDNNTYLFRVRFHAVLLRAFWNHDAIEWSTRTYAVARTADAASWPSHP